MISCTTTHVGRSTSIIQSLSQMMQCIFRMFVSQRQGVCSLDMWTPSFLPIATFVHCSHFWLTTSASSVIMVKQWAIKSSYLKDLLINEYQDTIGFKERSEMNKSVWVYDVGGGGNYIEAAHIIFWHQ